MPKLWTSKSSPGKGTGVFATQAMPSGTLILHDGGLVLDENSLPKFYALHEGSRQHASKAMRIYKANAFEDGKGKAWTCFDIGRLNHSCVPNAKLNGSRDESEMVDEMFAIRDIAAGEKIFIDYSWLEERTRYWRRRFPTQARLDARTSDARRQIIHHLYCNLHGKVPPSERDFEALPAPAGDWPHCIFQPRLSKPLTLQTSTSYHVLHAAVRETQGLGGMAAMDEYEKAAEGLLRQLQDELPAVVLASGRLIKPCIVEAEEARRKARGSMTDLAKNPSAKGLVTNVFAIMFGEGFGRGIGAIPLTRKAWIGELRKLKGPGWVGGSTRLSWAGGAWNKEARLCQMQS